MLLIVAQLEATNLSVCSSPLEVCCLLTDGEPDPAACCWKMPRECVLTSEILIFWSLGDSETSCKHKNYILP